MDNLPWDNISGRIQTDPFQDFLKNFNAAIDRCEEINGKCESNMKNLHNMMLELKGLIAMVRANARKNDWYKEEIQSTPTIEIKHIE